jgi:predicted  nucleic acid-binding Zn-ribbon protein
MDALLPRTMLRAKRHVERCPVNGKIRYRTKKKALKFRERSSQIIHRSLSVYQCEHCGGWHLTKQRQKAAA